jgi:hypothetical protein
LPALPRVSKTRAEHFTGLNKQVIREQPWTLGLVEAMAMVDVVSRQRLETRNRASLILLDSNFEIALKEFIVHRSDLFPPAQFSDGKLLELFKNRPNVISAITNKVNITASVLARASHYYALRNKLIHERATVDVTDRDVRNYRQAVEHVLQVLFGLNFKT